MGKLDKVDTIVIVMMENRSFDHMLGYLSLPPMSRQDVEGLHDDEDWLQRFENIHFLNRFRPFRMTDKRLPDDPPHERNFIQQQIFGPSGPMRGFVSSYASIRPVAAGDQPIVMGYYTPQELPIHHFFAQSFTVCDHWFSSLPASTQPNRLMALSGYTLIDGNRTVLPDQYLVYDWLNERNIRWRVYHDGFPFIMLAPRWAPHVAWGWNFRDIEHLAADVQDEGDSSFPQVIFVEPTYTDAPHLGEAEDDHPPTSVTRGQEFLRNVYAALTSKPDRWQRMLLIVTYDEHGGFFDHLEPPAVVTTAPQGAQYPAFPTLGVRVPAFIVSPLVDVGTVYSEICDNTTILKLLGEKFGKGSYLPIVDQRPVAGSIAKALIRTAPRLEIPPAPLSSGFQPAPSIHAAGFQRAMEALWDRHDAEMRARFPESWHFDYIDKPPAPGQAGTVPSPPAAPKSNLRAGRRRRSPKRRPR